MKKSGWAASGSGLAVSRRIHRGHGAVHQYRAGQQPQPPDSAGNHPHCRHLCACCVHPCRRWPISGALPLPPLPAACALAAHYPSCNKIIISFYTHTPGSPELDRAFVGTAAARFVLHLSFPRMIMRCWQCLMRVAPCSVQHLALNPKPLPSGNKRWFEDPLGGFVLCS